MNDVELGLVIRAVRRRLRLRQLDVARRGSVHRSTVGLVERGGSGRVTLDALRRIFGALDARIDIKPLWRGPHLDRLLDEEHSRLAAAWKVRLERWGWVVRVEVSFSRYGERGRIDLLLWHPALHILAVVEIKTDMVDSQELLGVLDVKTRLAPTIAAGLGWRNPAVIAPILIFKDDRTVRRRVSRLAPLFGSFGLRGRKATAWLHAPSVKAPPEGLLIFSDLTYGGVTRVGPVGRDRVAVKRPIASREVSAALANEGLPAVER